MTDRKHDTDGWPLCLTCGTGRAHQIDADECYQCLLVRDGLIVKPTVKQPLPFPYTDRRYK